MILTSLTNEELIHRTEMSKKSTTAEMEFSKRLKESEENLQFNTAATERCLSLQNKDYLKLLAVIHISGHFLTDYLPDDFNTMPKNLVLDFINNHKSEYFEIETEENIWDQINQLADSFVLFAEQLY